MDKRESFAPPAVGGSCLLVIFAVLCLTVFALLSLSTVQANDRLADASVEAVSAYYQADRQAETILAQLRSGQMPQGVTADGATYIYIYTCPISDTQSLEVRVRLEGDSWTVLRWQAVSTTQWEAGEGLGLWSGIMD